MLQQHFLSAIDAEWENLFLAWERILHKSSAVSPKIFLNKTQRIGFQKRNMFSAIKGIPMKRDVSQEALFILCFLYVIMCRHSVQAFSFYREKFSLINLFFKRTNCHLVASLIFINYQLESGGSAKYWGSLLWKEITNCILQEWNVLCKR